MSTGIDLDSALAGPSTSVVDTEITSTHEQEPDIGVEGPLNTPLHAAAVNGNKGLLQRLIHEAGGDANVINMGDRFGRTPLVYSVLGDRLDCAESLLKNGASVSLADVDGRTPLHWAAYQGNHKCVKLLLSKGANWKSKDTEGRTPLHFAASYNSCKCLSLLLKMAAKGEVDDPDNNSMTALHWGASFGNAEHVKMLLKYRASVKLLDVEKKTPLHWAATNQNANVVKLILEQSNEMINWRDTEGRTALHLAVAQQNEAVVRTLVAVETCNVSLQDNTDRAPLHWAAVLGNSKIVKLLLRRNPDHHSADGNGATPLHYCAQNDLAHTVEVFLSFSHMKDIPDKEGQTAIIWAAGKGASAALETMLHHNLDVHAADKSGGTALHAAAYAGHLKCVQLLLQHGAGVNALDMRNHTPIFRACETGHTDVVITLLESGANVNLEDQDGRSVLHWAALGGHTHICQTLMKNGVPADKKDRLGCTPLQCAAYGGFVNCMSVLIEYGAQVNTCDKEGISALHWSCSSGHLDAVKLLRRHGAFLNFMEVDGERLTPLDYAIFGDHQDVAQYMIEQGGLTITAIQDVAATAIQSCWRGYRVRKPFEDRKNLYMKHEQLKKDLHLKKQQELRIRRLKNGGNQDKLNGEYTLENSAQNYSENNDINGRTVRKESVLTRNQPSRSPFGSISETPEAGECLYDSTDEQRGFPDDSASDNQLSLSTIYEDSKSQSDRLESEQSREDVYSEAGNSIDTEETEASEHQDVPSNPKDIISEQIGGILQITPDGDGLDLRLLAKDRLNANGLDWRCSNAISDGSGSINTNLNTLNEPANAEWNKQKDANKTEQIQSWAIRARKERERLNLIRGKINAAMVIQQWFRRMRNIRKDRRETKRAITEILMDQEELKKQIAALVIQLNWRRYMRRKARKSTIQIELVDGNVNGIKSMRLQDTTSVQSKSTRTSTSSAESRQKCKSARTPPETGRAKSGVFVRRSVFHSGYSTTTDSRRHRKSAPSPAAMSYNLALDMYNPLSGRPRASDRASGSRRGTNKVKPIGSRRPATGWES